MGLQPKAAWHQQEAQTNGIVTPVFTAFYINGDDSVCKGNKKNKDIFLIDI